jgi:hypothetical protein
VLSVELRHCHSNTCRSSLHATARAHSCSLCQPPLPATLLQTQLTQQLPLLLCGHLWQPCLMPCHCCCCTLFLPAGARCLQSDRDPKKSD